MYFTVDFIRNGLVKLWGMSHLGLAFDLPLTPDAPCYVSGPWVLKIPWYLFFAPRICFYVFKQNNFPSVRRWGVDLSVTSSVSSLLTIQYRNLHSLPNATICSMGIAFIHQCLNKLCKSRIINNFIIELGSYDINEQQIYLNPRQWHRQATSTFDNIQIFCY